MKNKLIPILIGVVVVTLIVVFTMPSSNKTESKLNQIIKRSANDKKIDPKEFNEILAFIEINPESLDPKIHLDSIAFDTYLKKVSHNPNLIITIKEPLPPNLNTIRMYVETSASMRGYMTGSSDGSTNFQDLINHLLGQIDGEYNLIPFSANTIATDIIKYDDNMEFAQDLVSGNFEFGSHSPLHKVFDIMTNASELGDVSIFITDGIMSGTNQQIQNNPHYNIDQRVLLQTKIMTSFNKISNKFGLALYAFKSRFNCNSRAYYYDYQNTRINLQFTDRPFYVFVIGHKKILPEFLKSLEKGQYFKPEKSSYFGLNQKNQNEYDLFASHIQNPNCMLPYKEVLCDDINDITQSNPLIFALGFDLSQYPEFVQSIDYLYNNSRIEKSNTLKVESHKIALFDDSIKQEIRSSELNKLFNYTHYAEFHVRKLFIVPDTLKFNIDYLPDNWYQLWSSDNDQNITSTNDKTFNFEYLVRGIIDAYNERSVVNIKVPIKKY